MSIVPTIVLLDSSSQAWKVGVTNAGVIQTTAVSGTGLSSILLNDSSTSQVWALTVSTLGNLQTNAIFGASNQSQLSLLAPNGTVWLLRVNHGQLQTTPCDSTLSNGFSALGAQVANRLEEVPFATVFWDQQLEIYSALAEAANDLLLLVGRPDIVTNYPFTLTPNTVWQTIPKGYFCVTDIQGSSGQLWKTSIYALDYIQARSGSDWENDVADSPRSWFPVGLGPMFGVHPALSTALTVTLTMIQTPIAGPWPYSGCDQVPFHDEFYSALEMYASHVCRQKELSAEFNEGLELYQNYLTLAERMTTIEDRRDPLLFAKTLGARTGVNPITKR